MTKLEPKLREKDHLTFSDFTMLLKGISQNRFIGIPGKPFQNKTKKLPVKIEHLAELSAL